MKSEKVQRNLLFSDKQKILMLEESLIKGKLQKIYT